MEREVRLTVTLIFFICLSLAALTSWSIWSARKEVLAEVATNSLNLTQALDKYTESTIRLSTLLLEGIGERLETEGTEPANIQRVRNLINNQHGQLAQLSSVVAYDKDGDWLMSSKDLPISRANSSDRLYFIHHSKDVSKDIFIGPPIRSRLTNEWVITVSKRFNDKNGGFAGVIVVTLGVKNFLTLFGKIDVGHDGAIGLAYTDGQLLVRYPFREQDMGKNFYQSPIYAKYLNEKPFGTASYASSLDGVERLYAFRKNEIYPLVTTVALGKKEALSKWLADSITSIVIVISLLGAVALIGYLLIKDIRKRIKTEVNLLNAREALIKSNYQLQFLASNDQLTGLANRRSFDSTFLTESKRAQRKGSTLSLLMVDADFFKAYNDTYGHVAGDECLKAVSIAVKSCVRRPSDLVARYGGEELAIILPNTDCAGAVIIAKLILSTINALDLPHAGSTYGKVTVSIGIASRDGSATFEKQKSLIEEADTALYKAKLSGRNNFSIHTC